MRAGHAIARPNTEITRIILTPEATVFFDRIGLAAAPMAPAEFTDYIKAEIACWRDYVTIVGIGPQ